MYEESNLSATSDDFPESTHATRSSRINVICASAGCMQDAGSHLWYRYYWCSSPWQGRNTRIRFAVRNLSCNITAEKDPALFAVVLNFSHEYKPCKLSGCFSSPNSMNFFESRPTILRQKESSDQLGKRWHSIVRDSSQPFQKHMQKLVYHHVTSCVSSSKCLLQIPVSQFRQDTCPIGKCRPVFSKHLDSSLQNT